MSLMIGYVHPGMLHEEFAQSVEDLRCFDATKDGRHLLGGKIRVRGLYVADSRNQVCERFLSATYPTGQKPEWLLFLDTDIVFKPEDVYTLIDSADPVERPIVGGLYFGYMDGEPTPVWRQLHRNLGNIWGTMGTVKIGTVEPIDAVGMGFTLIHRNVLEVMQPHYANDKWTWFGHDLYHGERLGEDLTFCYRAAKLGFKTWGNSKVIVGHIKPFTIGLGHFIKATESAKHEANKA